jgi:hypothetical protein
MEKEIEDGYIFKGTPESIDTEKEVKNISVESFSFDPEKLSHALIILGQKITGITLYSYQYEPVYRIIYSLLVGDGAEITLLFARQSGKSEAIVFCVIVIGVFFPVLAKYFKELEYFKDGVKMGAFAPQLDQINTIYSRCVERIWSDKTLMYISDPEINDFPTYKTRFVLKSGSFLFAQSGAKQSKIESKTYHIIFIDESQDMDTYKVRKSIIPMTAATFGTIVRLGTPNRVRGDFYHTISNNKNRDRKLRTAKINNQLHFEYDYKKIVDAKKIQFKKDAKKFHLLYEKAVKRDANSMGINSDEFRMSYGLEWLLDIGMFITENRLEDLVYDKRINFPTLKENDFVVAGLDIASSRNSTVLTIGILDNPTSDLDFRPTKTILAWIELEGLDYEYQFEILFDVLQQFRVSVLYGDNTGVGRALMDRLVYHLSDIIFIVPYIFTPQTKSDMWKALDEDINARRIVIPANKTARSKKEFLKFEEQMLNLQKTWKGNLMVCQKNAGYSDDYCDSLALMNLAGNTMYETPQEVIQQDNEFYKINNISLLKESDW